MRDNVGTRKTPIWAAAPLLLLPVILYNLVAMLTIEGGLNAPRAGERMAEPVFSVPMASGALWTVGFGDLLVIAALGVLFVELLKSTSSRGAAVVNHGLSMALFIICLIEFLLLDAFATSAFFLITLMVLLDVLAGFVVSITAARRDFGVHPAPQ
jgi:hypothetical protein